MGLQQNALQHLISYSKLAYFQRDPKKVWKAMKFLTKKPNSVPTLTCGVLTATTENKKADQLNQGPIDS